MEFTNEQKGMDFYNSLVKNAWENPEFKKQLINNPSETISNFVGKDLDSKMPKGRELVVIDQADESKLYLIIPAKPALDLELSEAELEQVAGGGAINDAGVATGVAIVHGVKAAYNWVASFFE